MRGQGARGGAISLHCAIARPSGHATMREGHAGKRAAFVPRVRARDQGSVPGEHSGQRAPSRAARPTDRSSSEREQCREQGCGA